MGMTTVRNDPHELLGLRAWSATIGSALQIPIVLFLLVAILIFQDDLRDLVSGTPRGEQLMIHAIAVSDVREIDRALAQGCSIEARFAGNVTPLIEAASGSDVAIVRALLARGANPNASGDNGFTALCGAAITGDLANAGALLDAGADPSPCNCRVSPWNIAREHDDSQMLALLQKAQALRTARQVLPTTTR
jgi:hypothetical protein